MADLGAKRIAGKITKWTVPNWDHRIFTIEKAAASEHAVVVQFGRRVKYKVVKLSLEGLPTKDTDGRKIRWITNFAVLDPRGRYVKRVHYTLFLPAPVKNKKMTYVYYDHRGLRHGKQPKREGTQPSQPGMVQVDFYTGDPGVGCK